MMDYKVFGQRIRNMRRLAGMTQAELAERAGISASFLGHIERGTRVLSVGTLVALCRALGSTPNELLGLEYASQSARLPPRVTVCVPSFLQGMADLLKNEQISE